MKKIISAVLAVVLASLMVAGFAGCKKTSGETSSTSTTAAKPVLTMATNATFPPYEYMEGKNVVGIDAEIAQAIADKLGMTLKIENIEFNSIITGVQTGKYDMGMAGMTVTETRKKSVSFSTSYATGVQVVIVKKGSKITSVDDLSAKGAKYTVGVQLSTTGDIYATDDFTSKRVVEYKSGTDAVAALVAGKVDCVIIDNEPAKNYVKANTGLEILDTKYVEENYAICVAKDNTELLGKINGALKELTADGTVQKIIDKYITSK